MKLNSAQLERTLGQVETHLIPDDHPLIPQLNDLFGEHTFFLDRHGLNIVEPVEAGGVSGIVVNLASWNDDSQSGLEVHEPEATFCCGSPQSRVCARRPTRPTRSRASWTAC